MELLWQPANSLKGKQSEFIFLHECRVKVLLFQHPHILERVVAFFLLASRATEGSVGVIGILEQQKRQTLDNGFRFETCVFTRMIRQIEKIQLGTKKNKKRHENAYQFGGFGEKMRQTKTKSHNWTWVRASMLSEWSTEDECLYSSFCSRKY